MKNLEQINGEQLVEILPYQRVIRDIQEKLAAKILEIKNQKEEAPYLKDWVEIQVRMSGSNLVMKKEFCFAEIFRGVEEDLRKLIEMGEKNSRGSGVTFIAYLYPYEFKGRKILEDYRVKFNRSEKLKPEVRIEKFKEVESEIILAEDTIWKSEGNEHDEIVCEEISEVAEETQEQAVNVMEEMPVEKVVYRIRKERSKKISAEDLIEEVKKEIKLIERSAEFYDREIDFDFREWNMWRQDGTRVILKKVFALHGIKTPNDLKRFLGTENPSVQDWLEFIEKLNKHQGKSNLRMGLATQFSLRNWMRKNKMIPIEFRENI
jgi:hypothetical protein